MPPLLCVEHQNPAASPGDSLPLIKASGDPHRNIPGTAEPAWADLHCRAGTRSFSWLWVHLIVPFTGQHVTDQPIHNFQGKKVVWIIYLGSKVADRAAKIIRHLHLMCSHAGIIKKPKLQCSQGKAFLPCLHSDLIELSQKKKNPLLQQTSKILNNVYFSPWICS